MKCKKCGFEMIIDEWGGWVWTCFNCWHVGRRANKKELKKIEEGSLI